MDNDFNSMIVEYKSYSELQKFSEAQMLLIDELQKKIVFLEEKNSSLETIINNTSPLDITIIPITNQELICREQIERLKETSNSRDLSYEECKKVSEYSKILKDLQDNKKSIPSVAKKLSTTELLQQLETTNE